MSWSSLGRIATQPFSIPLPKAGLGSEDLKTYGPAATITAAGLLVVAGAWNFYCCIRPTKRPTGPQLAEGHWLLGNMLDEMKYASKFENFNWSTGLHAKYGKTFMFKSPTKPYVVDTTDPRIVEHVLKTNFENYVKGAWFTDRLTDLLGSGIFNADGDLWHGQRKTASHMFTANQFKNHIWKVVQKNCQTLNDLLRKSAQREEVVDLFNVLNRFTLDTIGSIGFARDIGSLSNADSPFLKSFDRAQQISLWRFINPMWFIFRALGLGEESEARRHFRLLADYSLETVRMLKEDPTGEKADSFVGMFVAEAKTNGAKVADDAFLKDMVLNFLIAGRDTTAQAMSWIFWLLMGHPEVEQKLLEEIELEIGDGPITYENSGRLRYLQSVINEGLRLYPSVPVDSKMSLADDVLPDGTILPAGNVVQYNIYAMGRCTELWGEDAAEFRPERWEGKNLPSSYIYPAFNAGPRECLGKRLAWVEMRACIAEVMRNFHLELAVSRECVKTDVQLTIGMSSGLPIRLRAR